MVSFYAYSSSDIQGTRENQAVVFDKVDTNLGGGYNGTTGVFTAPAAGQYQFAVKYMMLYLNSSYAYSGEVHLLKNGNITLRLFADTHRQEGNYDTASGLTVMGLNKGDKVSVVAYTGKLFFWGGFYSYFAGFLIG